MSKNYWLALFNGTTWEEFLTHGAKTMGFKENKKNSVNQIEKGDFLICYVSGISRFIGVLEVISEPYFEESKIWEMGIFPNRVNVKMISKLEPKNAIPVLEFKDKLKLFEKLKDPNNWSGFFLSAPRKFDKQDGEIIAEQIKQATKKPTPKDFDEKKYFIKK